MPGRNQGEGVTTVLKSTAGSRLRGELRVGVQLRDARRVSGDTERAPGSIKAQLNGTDLA